MEIISFFVRKFSQHVRATLLLRFYNLAGLPQIPILKALSVPLDGKTDNLKINT
jgi:hypothetical protein